MKQSHLAFLIAVVTALAAGQLRAGVKVSSGEVKERQVAFRTVDGKFLSTATGNLLNTGGVKIGSQQTFTLVDLNGGDVVDGDEVRIRYTPNTGGQPDPSKASYWAEVKEGVKRAKQGDVFKIKIVQTKYAFQTPSGKFLTGKFVDGVLAVTDKLDDALLVEILDISGGRNAAKPLVQSPTPAPEKPATETPAAPKPAE